MGVDENISEQVQREAEGAGDEQEQWVPGTLPSDAKVGTDDPAEEAQLVAGALPDSEVERSSPEPDEAS